MKLLYFPKSQQTTYDSILYEEGGGSMGFLFFGSRNRLDLFASLFVLALEAEGNWASSLITSPKLLCNKPTPKRMAPVVPTNIQSPVERLCHHKGRRGGCVCIIWGGIFSQTENPRREIGQTIRLWLWCRQGSSWKLHKYIVSICIFP